MQYVASQSFFTDNSYVSLLDFAVQAICTLMLGQKSGLT